MTHELSMENDVILLTALALTLDRLHYIYIFNIKSLLLSNAHNTIFKHIEKRTNFCIVYHLKNKLEYCIRFRKTVKFFYYCYYCYNSF